MAVKGDGEVDRSEKVQIVLLVKSNDFITPACNSERIDSGGHRNWQPIASLVFPL
jgi:hypothetical protein